MRLAVRNRVTMLGDAITAEVRPSRDGRRAWMMIRPTDDDKVMLVEFEHEAELDTDGWPAPEDVLDRKRTDFDSLDEVIDALEVRGIDTDTFDAPWKGDYPL